MLIGFRDKANAISQWEKDYSRRYVPVGLPLEFHMDQANLQSKFDPYCIHPPAIGYREFVRQVEGGPRKFAAIFVPPSSEILKAAKSGKYPGVDGRAHKPFDVASILFRHGTQSKIATKNEIDFIARRVKDTQYKLSVLNGQPDRVEETIYSNLFEVKEMPRFIYTARRSATFWNPDQERALRDHVAVYWNSRDVTFENLSDVRNPLWQSVLTETITFEETNSWVTDDAKRYIVERLLNAELIVLARQIELMKDPGRLRFYFPCPEDSRTVVWSPRFKDKSQLVVAKKTYSAKLRRNVCIHIAVNAQFVMIQDRVFLRLSPTLTLTADGIHLLSGDQVGPQITSLLHNRYNQTYLNNLLFWISQFSKNQSLVSLSHGAIKVHSTPATSVIPAGILADRPAAEDTPRLVQMS